MKYIFSLGAGLAAICSLPAQAHDAWIEAYPSEAGEPSPAHIELLIGHAEDRETYLPPRAHLSRIATLSESGMVSQMQSYEVFAGQARIPISPVSPTEDAVITISTFRAKSMLPAKKFNDYVAEEGITPIADIREERGQAEKEGREVYARHMKAMVTDLTGDCDLSFLSMPVGDPLEILPTSHPGAGCGDALSFRVLFMGQALEGATLHLNRTDAPMTPIKAQTDETGEAVFDRPDAGRWYVHAAWAQPVSEDRYGADFATSFASLSFELADIAD